MPLLPKVEQILQTGTPPESAGFLYTRPIITALLAET